jgi:Gluconate 2-dehydrogenase subunit 3
MAQSFRSGAHLPKNRRGGPPTDPKDLPRQRHGTTPQRHGRYPDYDVLANAGHWDPVTRELILERARSTPPVRFFTAVEEHCLRPFLDVLLAQDDEPRIPVFEMVDAKLYAGKLDGFQYDDMPDDRETWRLVARGLDESSGPDGFAGLSDDARRVLVERFSEGELEGGAWEQLNVTRAWSVVTRGALSEFYSHPWAWNEIGFGGPAYPRGYMRLQPGPAGREPYEAREAFETDPVEDVPARGLE